MTSLNTLWTRYMDIALGAPEVIARRLTWFGEPSPWTPERMWEAQLMVWEKAAAASRAWWSMYAASIPVMAWPPAGLLNPQRTGVAVREAQRHGRRMTQTASQVLQPYSSTVNKNVKRLRKRRSTP